MGEGETNS